MQISGQVKPMSIYPTYTLVKVGFKGNFKVCYIIAREKCHLLECSAQPHTYNRA